MTTTMQRETGPVPRPTKSVVRRPALVRKREETDIDAEADDTPSSPSKKIKVAFSNDVEVRIAEEWEKTPSLIRDEVQRALERHSRGDDSGYEQLMQVFSVDSNSDEAPSSTTIRNYTVALLSNASKLNRSCSGLVRLLLQSPWLGRDDAYVSLFIRFLGNLVSVQGFWLSDVLRMLVENMASAPPSYSPLHNQPPVTHSHMYGRTHLALKYLSQLIPPASSFLLPILTEIFPYASDSKRAHSAFVKNILKTIDYIPELRSDILALIADRLVKIDVQVQVDVEDLADDVENGLVQGIPKLKGKPSEGLTDSEDESNAESDDSDEELDPDTLRAKEIANNVEKLDMVMDMLFAYYDTSFPGVSADDREDLLLSQFSHIILQTYRSRHVQFLLFHFSQTSPASVDNFVGTCITIAFDKHRSAVMRQSAAAYLASFVARGNHVGPQIVRMVFEYLGLRLSELRADHERACRGPDLQRYSTYYSLVQALLYIFCFRWPALEVSSADEADSDSDLEEHNRVWIPGLKETLEQNIFSKLNPLKVCSPAIVTEFAKVANHLSVVYVYGLLETNKRLRLTRTVGVGERETALSGRKDEALQQLDGYFPFDPYHLPRSKRWVEADYRIWKGIPGLHDKDTAEDEESGSDEEAEDDSEGEEGTATDEGED